MAIPREVRCSGIQEIGDTCHMIRTPLVYFFNSRDETIRNEAAPCACTVFALPGTSDGHYPS